MMVIEDLKKEMSLRNISGIFGILPSDNHYKSTEILIQRLALSIKDRIKDITSERTRFGYRSWGGRFIVIPVKRATRR